jgi:WD40 repeat protein
MKRFCFIWVLFWSAMNCWADSTTQPMPSAVIQRFPYRRSGNDWQYSPPLISADGSKLYTRIASSRGDVDLQTIYDVPSGKQIYKLEKMANEKRRYLWGFSTDGRFVFALSVSDNRASELLHIIELADGYRSNDLPIPFGNPWITPDCKRMVVDNDYLEADKRSGILPMAVYDLPTGKIIGKLRTSLSDRPTGVFSTDSKLMLTDADGGPLTVWNISSVGPLSILTMSSGDSHFATQFIYGNKEIRDVNARGVIQTWDTNTGERLSTVDPPRTEMSQHRIFTPDGRWLMYQLHGLIGFEDAEGAKDIRVWRFDPHPGGFAYLDTFRGDTILVSDPAVANGDLLLMRVPPISTLPILPSNNDKLP